VGGREVGGRERGGEERPAAASPTASWPRKEGRAARGQRWGRKMRVREKGHKK